jgi:hypothetical protein
MNRPVQKVPGYNVDRVDVAAGLRELKTCGYGQSLTAGANSLRLARRVRGSRRNPSRGGICQIEQSPLLPAELACRALSFGLGRAPPVCLGESRGGCDV